MSSGNAAATIRQSPGGPSSLSLLRQGITDILSKSLGSSNPINIVHAAMAGLRQLKRPEEIAEARGRDLDEIAPRPMLEAVAEAQAAMAAKRAEAGLDEGAEE